MTLRTRFERTGEYSFSGSVFDPEEPDRRFVVELLLDGFPAVAVLANRMEATPHVGDGRHGFRYRFEPEILHPSLKIEARVANTVEPCGHPIFLSDTTHYAQVPAGGEVSVAGNDVFRGWLEQATANPRAIFVVDGAVVASVEPDRWVQRRNVAGDEIGVPAFTAVLQLDPALQPPVTVHVYNEVGTELDGSPILYYPSLGETVKALMGARGSKISLAELQYYQNRFPKYVPMPFYEEWKRGIPQPEKSQEAIENALVLVGSGDVGKTLSSLDRANGSCRMAFTSSSSASSVSMRGDHLAADLKRTENVPDYLVFAPAGTVLDQARLDQMVQDFAESECIFAYGDLEENKTGILYPLFFPAFDYERMLEQGYCSLVFAARTSEIIAMLRDRSVESLYSVVFGLLERSRQGKVMHFPFPIACLPDGLDIPALEASLASATHAHLRRRGLEASIYRVARSNGDGTLPAVRVYRERSGPISIDVIVPTRDRSDLLKACVDSLFRQDLESCSLTVYVVDNGSVEEETFELFSELELRGVVVLRDDGPFNFSRINNDAVRSGTGEYILFLNNDVTLSDQNTLEELASRIVTESSVGGVGMLLYYPSQIIQHGGVVFGPEYAVTHAYVDRMLGSEGYADGLKVAHQGSAVTAACMLVRRDDFLDVGGFDEAHFPIAFNDVDLCAKLVERGKRIVFTPHVSAEHQESVSRGSDTASKRWFQFCGEFNNLRMRYHKILVDDPFYSPNLDRSHTPYSALNGSRSDIVPRIMAYKF